MFFSDAREWHITLSGNGQIDDIEDFDGTSLDFFGGVHSVQR